MMSEGRFTSGPWKMRVPQPAEHPSYTVVDGNGKYVAQVAIRAHNSAGDDARLIASSPTMYEYISKMAQEGDTDAAKIIANING